MGMNLVSLIMKFLTPDMIGRIASALGLDRNVTSSAIEAGVPALLAAFAGVAEKPGGPQKLADAAKQEVGTLDKFAGMLGATGQTSVVERGSRMLGSLLGGDQAELASAVGKYTGVGASKGGSLLGALGPLVMGAIAQQQGPRAVDGGSIAGLLAGQKDNIAAALPSGFGKLLGGTGLLDALGDTARRTAAAGGEATRAAAASMTRTIDDTRRSAAGGARHNELVFGHPGAGDCRLAFLAGWPACRTGGAAGCHHRAKSDGGRARRRQAGHRHHRQPALNAQRHH